MLVQMLVDHVTKSRDNSFEQSESLGIYASDPEPAATGLEIGKMRAVGSLVKVKVMFLYLPGKSYFTT